MAVEIVGKPSPEGMKILWDAFQKWYEAGCLRYTCMVCYSPLTNESEMMAQLCAYHLVEEEKKIYPMHHLGKTDPEYQNKVNPQKMPKDMPQKRSRKSVGT
jgi:hypothetical protein